MFARRNLLLALIPVALMSACSTPGDLKARAPLMTEASSKNPQTLAACIGDRLINVDSFRFMSSRPTAGGYVVMQEENLGWGPNTTFIIEILEAGKGSQVKVVARPDLRSGPEEKIRSAVKGCV